MSKGEFQRSKPRLEEKKFWIQDEKLGVKGSRHF